MSAAIQTLIENKETELANNKRARDHYNEYYGYLIAECEQDIYDLNVKLQLAEAEEEEDEGWNTRASTLNPVAAAFVPLPHDHEEGEEDEGWNVGLAARQTATWVPYADGGDQLCYQCNGYTEACGCGEPEPEPEPEVEFQEPAHREGTKLKWVSSTNPETYSVAIVKKDGILEVKRVTDGAGHCHDTTLCQCHPCSEISLSNRLGAPIPPWLRGAPLLKTLFATEAEWRASLPGGGLRGSIKTTVPAISERTLKKLCVKPLTGTTDALKVKELAERFPGGTMVLTTATEQLEIEHIYYDIAAYPEISRHQIYSKKHEQAVFDFANLGESPRSNGKPQLMVEWRGLYIDLSHLF